MKHELIELVRLAAPIAAAQLGLMGLGVVDTAVVGRLGELELGAVGLGNAVFFSIALFGGGLLLGFEPLIAQALGAGRAEKAHADMWQGVWVAMLLGLPIALVISFAGHALAHFGIDPETARLAAVYVDIRALGVVPFMVFMVVRVYLQALHLTTPILVSVVLANVVNAVLDWLLVLGDDGLVRLGLSPIGLPALGVAGAAIASVGVAVLQLVVIAVAAARLPSGPVERRPRPARWRAPLAVGVPSGLQRLAEAGVFSVVGVLMATIDTLSVAAHQVAMTLASVSFMVPLGINAAVSIQVGRAVGASDTPGVRRAGMAALMVGAAYMAMCALVFMTAPGALARLLTDEASVVRAAEPLLGIAALFQISDGLQVVAIGALRGAGDTKLPFLLNLISYYLLGLPLGAALAFGAGMGGPGLWWGLAGGLTVVAVMLVARFLRISARPVALLEPT